MCRPADNAEHMVPGSGAALCARLGPVARPSGTCPDGGPLAAPDAGTVRTRHAITLTSGASRGVGAMRVAAWWLPPAAGGDPARG